MTDDTLLDLSAQLWRWMSDREVEPLRELFADEAVFVHMGATFSKDEELDVIASGRIHYRDIDISETSVRRIGETAIVLTTMRMTAVVGGDEVTNPFTTTGVFTRDGERWRLGALAFTRLITA